MQSNTTIEKNEDCVKENDTYLHIAFDFSHMSTHQREERLKRISKRLRIPLNGYNELELVKSKDSPIFSFLLKQPQLERVFKPFYLNSVKISPSITKRDLGDMIKTIIPMTEFDRTRKEEIVIVDDEQTVIKNISAYSDECTELENPHVTRIISNFISKKRFSQRKHLGFTLVEVNCENIDDADYSILTKNVDLTFSELDREFKNKFQIEKGMYRLKSVNISDFLFSQSIQNRYVSLCGYFNGTRQDFDQNANIFNVYLQDEAKNRICCKITNQTLWEYWKNVKDDIHHHSVLICDGILKIEKHDRNTYPVLDCKSIVLITDTDQSKITYNYQMIGKVPYYFENDRSSKHCGLYSRSYDQYGEMTNEIKILEDPLVLNNVYIDENTDFIYDFSIGLHSFSNYLENIFVELAKNKKNIVVCGGDVMQKGISNILREAVRTQEITASKVYSIIGIHSNEAGDIHLVTPFNQKIIPTTDKQREIYMSINSNVHVLGDFTLSNDENIEKEKYDAIVEQSLKNYHTLIEWNGFELFFRMVSAGFSAIAPFFKILSKTKKIDVFPLYFAVGAHGAGKTSLLRLMICELFGIPIILSNTLDTPSRIRDIMSSSTLPILADEVETIPKPSISALKSIMTSMGKLGYKLADQTWVELDMTNSMVGTANAIEFLEADSAFKEGRSLLTNHKAQANTQNQEKYEQIRNSIVINPKIGLLLLDTSINFIHNYRLKSQEDGINIKNDVEALLHLIEVQRNKLRILVNKYEIKLSDPRRLTMNALLIVGLTFWQYLFTLKYGKESEIINNFLRDESPQLIEFLRDFEKQTTILKYEELHRIRTYIQTKYNDVEKEPFIYYRGGYYYLTRAFLDDYNEHAHRSGNKEFTSLEYLADYISTIIKKKVEEKRRIFNTKTKKQVHSVVFDPAEILGEGIEPDEAEIIEETTSKVSRVSFINEVIQYQQRKDHMKLKLVWKTILTISEKYEQFSIEDICTLLISETEITTGDVKNIFDLLLKKGGIKRSNDGFILVSNLPEINFGTLTGD